MSAAPASSATAKAGDADKNGEAPSTAPAAQLEEDDEFEDFPIEDWTEEESQLPGGNSHLWEESWDDGDTSDDFVAQLRQERKKAGHAK